MGEAKRKRLLRSREWKTLFDGSPARVAISRPEYRPEATRGLEAHFAANTAEYKKTGKRTLCGNEDCGTEITETTQVYACIEIPGESRAVMGFCAECGKKSTDEILAMLQKTFHTFDPSIRSDFAQIRLPEIAVYTQFDVGGIKIAVTSPDDCRPAIAFTDFLGAKQLPQFSLFFHGHHNCHQLVEALYVDFKELRIEEMFSYKTGSSKLIASEYDPKGLHSWVEADGWAIDKTLSGTDVATGTPVLLISRVDEFYAWRQLTDIHDIKWQQAA